MQTITSFNKMELNNNNLIKGEVRNSNLDRTTIKFNGKNNLIYVEDGVNLIDSIITFNGDNSILYLSKSKHKYIVNLSINNNSCIFIGSDNYFNGRITLVTSERKNIIIGNDCLFSFGITIRVADPHLIYNCDTKERINQSKSVLIGDHVWIGQNSLIFKNSIIGSGSIVGGGSVLSGKKIPSNTIVAGNPSKVIKNNVFFSGECVHNWTEEQSNNYNSMKSEEWIYKADNYEFNFSPLDNSLSTSKLSREKLEIIKKEIVSFTDKNRFFIPTKISIRQIIKKFFVF